MLFNYIPNLDVSKATSSLNSYITNCPPLTPEKPAPKPLAVTFSQQPELRGKNFNPQTYDTRDAGVKVGMRITKVLMGSQSLIDSIQFFLSDGMVEHAEKVVGNRQFNHEYNVPANDEIKCIRFGVAITRNDTYTFASMQFVTKKNETSQIYKGTSNISEYLILCLNSNDDHLVGFHGHVGSTFESIGFSVMS